MNVNLILLSRTMRRDLFVFLRAALRFIGESIQNTGIKTMLKKCLLFTFLIDLRNEYPVLKTECSFIILVLITKTGAELGSVLAAIIINWILLDPIRYGRRIRALRVKWTSTWRIAPSYAWTGAKCYICTFCSWAFISVGNCNRNWAKKYIDFPSACRNGNLPKWEKMLRNTPNNV